MLKNTNGLTLDQPAIFPTMLAERLIQCFTTADQRVGLERGEVAQWAFSLE